jgi:PII-like signaling protein
MIPSLATLLTIYLNANERFMGVPLYRTVVEKARALHLAGVSVFPVDLSFGVHRQLRDSESEYSSYEIPVIIEIVDSPEKVSSLVGELDAPIGEGLLMSRQVRVVRYTHATEVPRGDITGIGRENSEALKREGAEMRLEGEAQRVTVYIGSSDTHDGRHLALAIVERCRAMGIAGATVSRGIMGFGKHSIIHRAHFLGLSEDLPVKVEVIDRLEEISRLLPVLDEMIGGGLIVVEDVHVVRYRHKPTS